MVMTSSSTSGGPHSRLSIIRKKTLYKKLSVSLNHSHRSYLKTLMNTTFMSSKILVTFPSKKVRIALVVHYLKNSWLTKMLSKSLTGDLILKSSNLELSTYICRLRECWLLPDYPLIMLMLFFGSRFTKGFLLSYKFYFRFKEAEKKRWNNNQWQAAIKFVRRKRSNEKRFQQFLWTWDTGYLKTLYK